MDMAFNCTMEKVTYTNIFKNRIGPILCSANASEFYWYLFVLFTSFPRDFWRVEMKLKNATGVPG